MPKRLSTSVAIAAAALVVLSGCSDDDDATTLAEGQDVELVGDEDLAGQTLDVSAVEEDGEVTGELLFTDVSGEVRVRVDCADTDADGVVILGGTIIGEEVGELTGLVALFIEEGDPDRVAISLDEEETSCTELLETQGPLVLADDDAFVDVETGSDIKTG